MTIVRLDDVREAQQKAASDEVTALISRALSEAFNGTLKACIKNRWPTELETTARLFLAELRTELEHLEQSWGIES